MDHRDTAPDSWELEEDAEAPTTAAGLSAAIAALNVNAKPFVPNINAAVFVPSFFQSAAVESPPVSEGRFTLGSCLLLSALAETAGSELALNSLAR